MLSGRISDWSEQLQRCGRKPTRKRVHALRVSTLRIQAEVEDELNDLPRASHEARAVVRFGRLAEKLRDALGTVRELDVWIGKLDDLQMFLRESATYLPRSSRETIRQIGRLQGRLKKKRERAGAKLVSTIEKRSEDLRSAARSLEQAASPVADEAENTHGPQLLREFNGIVAEFPAFDESNLHEFRKRIKKVRYVAEIHSADPTCGRIAGQMKNAQGAIGEWHDWQVLVRTAGHGKHAKDVEIVELLSSLTAEAFEKALAVCDGVVRRMSEMQRELAQDSSGVRKRPVSIETAASASELKRA